MNLVKTLPRPALFLALSLVALTASAAERYYRYENHQGVTVMDSRIPPEYVKNGYEIVTITGRVLEVVPPAPSAEEMEALKAQRERERELAEWDSYLQRRYSSVEDIEAARKRKLAEFDASMSILRGNANAVDSQIDSVRSRAANLERAGRAVPEVLLENLAQLNQELAKLEEQMTQRLLEKKELEDRFEREKDRFAQITADEK